MDGASLQPFIEQLIREKDWPKLKSLISAMHPADVAEIIIAVPDETDVAVFRLLDRERASQVFSYLPAAHQEGLIHCLSHEQMEELLKGMTPDDQARLLDELPAEVSRRILETVPQSELTAARKLLGYPERSAGRYMTPAFVALRPDMSASDALRYVKLTGKGKETLNVLYVVDQNGVLLEDVRLGSLVLADENKKVIDIKDAALVAVRASDSVDELLVAFQKYDRSALPVTDNEGKMLGIVTADDILDVAQKKATDEMQRLGGSEALDIPYRQIGLWPMLKKRGGWLAALFIGETLTATAMGHFEAEIEKAAVVALFVPLIISSGGNSGSQATSIIIRSLALRELSLSNWTYVFGKEIIAGLALGSFLGFVGFVRILLWYYVGWQAYDGHPYLIACTVWASLIGVVGFGSLVGSMLPFVLRRLGFDPATASAPFVATLVDVTGLIIYFTIAMLILRGTLL